MPRRRPATPPGPDASALWPVTGPQGLPAPGAAPTATGLDDEDVVHDALVAGADLSGATAADLDLARCTFRACSFVGARLTGAELLDVAFEGCDLAGAIVEGGRWTRVRISEGRARGLVLDGIALLDVALVDVPAPGMALSSVTGRRVGFRTCDLTGAEARDARLVEAAFVDCELAGLDLVRGEIAARFVRTRMGGVTGIGGLRGSVVDRAGVLDLAEAMAAHLGLAVAEPPEGDAEDLADR